METVDNKSNTTNRIANRIFYTVFALLILGSVGATYFKIVMQKDYQIEAETSCDPQTEKCFVRTCDPADDSTCPINENERTSYYKMVSKKASNIVLCEATVEKIGCNEELFCTQNEPDCSYTFCDPTTADKESCSFSAQ